jgi:hypothetical protein
MSISLLKEYVDLILIESALDPTGFALGVYKSSQDIQLVLWDSATLLGIINSGEKLIDVKNSEWLVGYMHLGPKEEEDHWNGREVFASAARSGYGPTMYDLAMAIASTIYADRDVVSKEARGVWDFYLKNRDDVEKLPFDDIEDPQTPPIIDDSEVFSAKWMASLNYAYKGKGIPSGALRKTHATAVAELAKVIGWNPRQMSKFILAAGEKYFEERYMSRR